VLHVDDDPNDALLLRTAAQTAGVRFVLRHVEDGETAIAYLAGQGTYADRSRHPLPELILLDLRMPGVTGLEILRWIRSRKAFRQVPVVVLSGSELEEDRKAACAAGATSFVIKPFEFEGLIALVRTLHSLLVAEPGRAEAKAA
jgi:CheY-like chemotaxis protein